MSKTIRVEMIWWPSYCNPWHRRRNGKRHAKSNRHKKKTLLSSSTPGFLAVTDPLLHFIFIFRIDAHCGGLPARVVVAGAPNIPGNSAMEKRVRDPCFECASQLWKWWWSKTLKSCMLFCICAPTPPFQLAYCHSSYRYLYLIPVLFT